MKTSFIFSILLLCLLGFSSCEKDNGNGNSEQLLIIENGAVSTTPDQPVTYTAALVDLQGNKTAASSVTWSSSNQGAATIGANGQISIAGAGVTTIKASVSINGVTLTAEAPLNIKTPSAFVVAPSAILVDTKFPDLQLEPIYLGTGSSSYNYQSSNSSIATVSSTGLVSFVGTGSCEITVNAPNLDGNPSVVVPVVVLGAPTIKLPITRIVLSPSSYNMLKTETQQFSAKAYDLDNQEVSTSFDWSIADPSIASIDANGTVTPLKIGETSVRATAQGITGEAQLIVSADKVILLDPYYTTIAAGQSRQLQATQYNVIRNGQGELALGSTIPNPSLTWEVPTYGLSIFDIATVSSSGMVSIKSNASPGLVTFVVASDANDPEVQSGISTVSVAIGSGGGSGGSCNCGTQNADAVNIDLSSSSTVNMSVGQTSQIQATVVDAQGAAVSGAQLVYCSDNVQVADVDASGEITATGFSGTANITVCHGNLSKTVVVNL